MEDAMFNKNKVAALLAELFGTFVLASAVIGVATKISIPYFSAVVAGATVALFVGVVGKISGSHLNPAVTFGFWSLKQIETAKAVAYIAMQLLGGLAAWKLAEYFFQQQLPNIAGKDFDWRVFLAEAIGTFIFTFAIASAVSQKLEGGRLAAVIGMGLFSGIIVASMGSNGMLNPAVALAMHSYSLSYVLGPIVGGLLGMNVYKFVFETSVAVPAKSARKTAKKKK